MLHTAIVPKVAERDTISELMKHLVKSNSFQDSKRLSHFGICGNRELAELNNSVFDFSAVDTIYKNGKMVNTTSIAASNHFKLSPAYFFSK